MQMRAGRISRTPHSAQCLSRAQAVSGRNLPAREMPIQGTVSKGMANHDKIAVASRPAGKFHHALLRRVYGRTCRRREIDASVKGAMSGKRVTPRSERGTQQDLLQRRRKSGSVKHSLFQRIHGCPGNKKPFSPRETIARETIEAHDIRHRNIIFLRKLRERTGTGTRVTDAVKIRN